MLIWILKFRIDKKKGLEMRQNRIRLNPESARSLYERWMRMHVILFFLSPFWNSFHCLSHSSYELFTPPDSLSAFCVSASTSDTGS